MKSYLKYTYKSPQNSNNINLGTFERQNTLIRTYEIIKKCLNKTFFFRNRVNCSVVLIEKKKKITFFEYKQELVFLSLRRDLVQRAEKRIARVFAIVWKAAKNRDKWLSSSAVWFVRVTWSAHRRITVIPIEIYGRHTAMRAGRGGEGVHEGTIAPECYVTAGGHVISDSGAKMTVLQIDLGIDGYWNKDHLYQSAGRKEAKSFHRSNRSNVLRDRNNLSAICITQCVLDNSVDVAAVVVC